jgi:hypothetical protein
VRRLVTAGATWTFLVLIIEMSYFAAAADKFLTLNDLSLITDCSLLESLGKQTVPSGTGSVTARTS